MPGVLYPKKMRAPCSLRELSILPIPEPSASVHMVSASSRSLLWQDPGVANEIWKTELMEPPWKHSACLSTGPHPASTTRVALAPMSGL
jgi:hypothetical protein